MTSEAQARVTLRTILDSAIESALPGRGVLANLPKKPKGRCVVVGAGKASAAMAAEVHKAWPDVDLSGVVVTRYGHSVSAGRITILEAGHPVPDEASVLAAESQLSVVSNLTPDDLVLALVSGGGSATLAMPIEGLSLATKQAITEKLLVTGASIGEINLVRRHLSKIKGGGLARAAFPASLHTLVVSDVPGDEVGDVASGPTVAMSWEPTRVREILDRYSLPIPSAVEQYLERDGFEDSVYPESEHRVVSSPSMALTEAATSAQRAGFKPIVLGDCIEGESSELGVIMAGIVRSVRSMNQPAKPPVALISGGETCVTIRDLRPGRGGRNTEFALSMALALNGEEDVFAGAVDTDGIDGTEDAAGALITPSTLLRASERGIDARRYLDRHDSYSFFEAIDDLIVTGPTLTNVNDVRVVLVY
jgi:glycerate 2-kinase